jgi:nucleoside-diphosphate-sugar epimerase
MRVLVTGADGFIGKELVKHLISKYDVLCLVRSNDAADTLKSKGLECIVADITDREGIIDSLRGIDVDAVFHLAALNPLVRGKDKHYRVNIEGMRNLVDALSNTNVKEVVYAQGLGVYGDVKGSLIDEHSSYNPSNWFTKMRSEAERILIDAGKRYGFSVKIAVLGDVYGNGGWFKSIVIDRLRNGTFRIPGSGNYYRCFVHVYDAARALEVILSKGYDKVIVCDDEPCIFKDFIYYTADMLRVKRPSSVPLFIAKLFLGSSVVDTLTASVRAKNDRLRSFFALKYPNYRVGVKEVIDEIRSTF